MFPLEKNESVRTRLTHSHEVSNLARSLGTYIVNSATGDKIAAECAVSGTLSENHARRAVPAVLAAVGLAHDIGNPPFGHQGEQAISSWVRRHEAELFNPQDEYPRRIPSNYGHDALKSDLAKMSEENKKDFLAFEGNAQTLRILSRLQVVKDHRGLNLTFGTLSALMKYTVGSTNAKGKRGTAAEKKFGFFSSERALVRKIYGETGLSEKLRHPLTYLMEACDDIAYSVVDAEDAIKKQIISFADIIAWLKSHPAYQTSGGVLKWITDKSEVEAVNARKWKLSPAELSDVSVQMFRAYAIGAMISAVITAFEDNYDELMTGTFPKSLLEVSHAHDFCAAMKDFDFTHAYKHRGVLEIELNGYNVLQGVMDLLWRGIVEREEFVKLGSDRTSPFARYAYSRLSENYRRVFEGKVESPVPSDASLPIRYRELQLLTDTVSGMTDQYAIDLYNELRRFHVGASA